MLGYRATLDWLLWNDDTTFLDDDPTQRSAPVTVALVADIFGHSVEKVIKDLLRRRETHHAD